MEKIRVLIVDDSAVVRRIVAEEIDAQPDMEVAGVAVDGRAALEAFERLAPDLVVLDVEMPEMDGLAALPRLRALRPDLPVVMFSSKTELGAAAALEALALGASDFFAKPTGQGGMDGARRVVRSELIPALRALGARRPSSVLGVAGSLDASPGRRAGRTSGGTFSPVASAASSASSAAAQGPSSVASRGPAADATERLELVVVGASTGGPNALAELFALLPGDLPVPLLVVQHMPPLFTRLLAERLTKNSSVRTEEAESGVPLVAGRAWIAPGDFHLELESDGVGTVRMRLTQAEPENACRPAVDPLLRSAARIYGRGCLAVVLTGMGQDGLRGCEAVRAAGGRVLAQDEASSVVWGMPGAVIKAGLAERVLPPSMMAGEIVRRARRGRA